MIDERIIGTWRRRSTKAVDDDGKPLEPPLGPTPNGVSCFQANGRMYSVICDGRVQLPAGRQIAGFGPNGTIYLLVREGREVFLEKTRVVNQ